jgi:tetratricopeptide (TPR) repeat protein
VAEAKDKVKKDIYEKAISAYSQAVKTLRRSDCAKAKEYFEAIIEKYPTEKELVDRAKIYLAICENRQKKDAVSLKTFDDYFLYAVYKLNQEDFAETVKLLEKAIAKEPKEGKAVYLMALAYCQMGDVEKCLESLKEAVHLDKFFGILARNELSFEPLWEDKKFKVITKMA